MAECNIVSVSVLFLFLFLVLLLFYVFTFCFSLINILMNFHISGMSAEGISAVEGGFFHSPIVTIIKTAKQYLAIFPLHTTKFNKF